MASMMFAAADGLEIGSCNVTLHHIGYEGGQRHKIARNVPMLRDYLAKDPTASIAGGISARCCYWRAMRTARPKLGGAASRWRGSTAPAVHQQRHAFFSLILLAGTAAAGQSSLLEEAVALFPEHLALRWLAAGMRWSEARRGCEEGPRRARLDRPRQLRRSATYPTTRSCSPMSAARVWHFAISARAASAKQRNGTAARLATAPDPRACEVRAQLAAPRLRPSC